MQLQKGQKIKFTDMGLDTDFTVECNFQSNMTIDMSCFGISEEGKLVDDRYMVFYNQKSSPNQEIKFTQDGKNYKFHVNAQALPANASKLVFTAAIDGSENMSQLGQLEFKIGNVSFTLTGKDFSQEKAIIIAEVYKRDNIWRVNAVGQGFNGGLEALLTSFGGQSAAITPAIPLVSSPVEQKKTIFLENDFHLKKHWLKKLQNF